MNRTRTSLLTVFAIATSAVVGLSSDPLFIVNDFAKRSLTISSVTAAIGFFADVCFISVSSGVDVRKFRTLAMDVDGSYFLLPLIMSTPVFAHRHPPRPGRLLSTPSCGRPRPPQCSWCA
ncbi:hypothetical protein BJV77DRAFT_758978 [Russula vinacea]|nr:hypothetical protein BJV77DRAFT_758978 [Russula vinacea]